MDIFDGLDAVPVESNVNPSPASPQIVTPQQAAAQQTAPADNAGDAAAQFRDVLTKAYPTKSQDPNWLNQQVAYFVAKSKSGEQMGNGQTAPMSYWLDRAAGQGAGGADVAEAGQYAGQDFGGQGGSYGATATNPYGDFAYKPLGDLATFNAPASLTAPNQVTAAQIAPQTATTQQATTAQAQAIMASPAYAQAGPAVQAAMLANPEKFGGVSAADLAADPSYQFRLAQGQGALENSNSARGLSRTGGAYKGLIDYGQNAASQEYGNVYARKFGEFNNAFAQNYQVGSTNAANKLAADTFNSGQQTNVNLANAGWANQAGLANAGAQNQVGLFNAGATNAASQFNAGQANNTGQFNVGNNLAAQGQNVSNSLATQNANNANALAWQGQGYNQAANTYGLNLQGQQQGYQQALGGYNANVNAGLGYGNLGVSQGQLGLGYGNLGLNTQGQNWRQGFDYNNELWNRDYKLTNVGNPYGGG